MSTDQATTPTPIDVATYLDGTAHTITVSATIVVPGLAVAPAFSNGKMNGLWAVYHTPSGRPLPPGAVHFDVAHRVAAEFAALDLDWTLDATALAAVADNADIKEAVRRGKYPPPPPDTTPDGKPLGKPLGPGDWPYSYIEATATQMAGVFTVSALQRHRDGWDLVRYPAGDQAAQLAFLQNGAAMVGEYGVVHLLRALVAADPDAADAAARDLWEACEAGDSFGEWLAEWAEEYGVPVPEEPSSLPGLVKSPAMAYEVVLRSPLPYTADGTVGSLRQNIADVARLAEEQFGQLLRNPAGGKPHLTDETLTAGTTCWYAWSLVALLGWLAKEHPPLAIQAASMIDDIGANGGNTYCEDVASNDPAV